MPWTGTCSAPRDAMTVDIKIDGLRIVRPLPKVISRIEGSSDFVIIGSEKMKVRVELSNVVVVGAAAKHCDDPPMSLFGTCGNTCYSAEVVTDGSYIVGCAPFGSKVADGACAPVIGRADERCPGGAAHKDASCIASGLRCNATA